MFRFLRNAKTLTGELAVSMAMPMMLYLRMRLFWESELPSEFQKCLCC
jgi:hypothetical protein